MIVLGGSECRTPVKKQVHRKPLGLPTPCNHNFRLPNQIIVIERNGLALHV